MSLMKAVRIHELPTELPSQQPAHGCLARTHHTHDEDNQVTSIFTSPSSHSRNAGVPAGNSNQENLCKKEKPRQLSQGLSMWIAA